METSKWYSTLIKPSFAPPAWVFAPVWTFLYILIAASYGYVTYLFFQKKIPFIVFLPFLLNIIFNLAYSPIQFSLQNNLLGTADILLILGTLIWELVAIYPYVKWVSLINTPYFLWVSFATVLQVTITILNR